MVEVESVKPYGAGGDKREQVEAMFDNIAPTYDTLNHRLSWNIDRYWRNRAIKELANAKPQQILDVATGTGDFAILQAEKLRPERITAVDISEGMMAIGREKVERQGLQGVITFAKEDCTALSYPSDTFDTVTSAFGIRNFQDLKQGLAEMCRVLKPGGMLCILELTTPVNFPMKQLFGIYSHTVLPLYGRLISKDAQAYSYLNKSIAAFPQGETMMEILRGVGFRKASFHRLTFGVCTLYIAYK
ncbi:MAG: bifunctional demethylmenaquinone methyltransferase/2-methoxy-6-polyprenyl-1,4-benzoquinol methylase UbiE [Prevotella sp.]|nr:bifunctional demethylmenaquinone methyltransferase/2-methoxy-6-polyprenyl-1,4-benzoquinol methylase UbiE [Prevotella sp.]MBR1839666.1 bifunctional demethylmenaquinone methyltransferase/2-methoxy-6-polyprenyl-1,4-benzoquinol methylase UbiE [Prevotella sp.]